MTDIHKRILTSKVPGNEGLCKASNIIDNQVVQRLDDGISGWFRKVEKRRRWYFLFLAENYKMIGPEFHGIVYFGTEEVVPTDPEEEEWDEDLSEEIDSDDDDDIVDDITTAAVAVVVADSLLDDEYIDAIDLDEELPDEDDLDEEYHGDMSEIDASIEEQIEEVPEYVEVHTPDIEEPLYVEPEPIVEPEPVYEAEPEPIVEPEPEPEPEPSYDSDDD